MRGGTGLYMGICVMSISNLGALTRLEKKDGNLTQVEVDEMLGLVSNI